MVPATAVLISLSFSAYSPNICTGVSNISPPTLATSKFNLPFPSWHARNVYSPSAEPFRRGVTGLRAVPRPGEGSAGSTACAPLASTSWKLNCVPYLPSHEDALKAVRFELR
ncbi:hypothetical protein B0T26DRAFT_700176 [Lasiosphaeria miniovina]|uniref:Uncharacterized protein n=1 Tax=Lasiosphaeria miniovina TaxID=1954250 RepID=A0AA40E402_9PEZI|nr:uncharacterized protein B0T26DRAFT_700176 [Lasiosphaeria miniovina]KAK0721743.1 hypothetical protein B0T26DRAFT_700176 [Lasiosphaeria miniovina]